MFGLVELQGQSARGDRGGEFRWAHWPAFSGRALDCDYHEGWAIQNRFKRGAHRILCRIRDTLDVVEGTILKNGDGFRIVQWVRDKRFEFGKSPGIMVSNKLVNQDDLAVNLRGQRVRLSQQMVFRVVLYRASGRRT